MSLMFFGLAHGTASVSRLQSIMSSQTTGFVYDAGSKGVPGC